MKLKIVIYGVSVLLFSLWGCQPKPPSVKLVEIDRNWKFKAVNDTAWLKAKVPGTVHTDLMSNGKIEEPYFRLNELKQQWIDKKDWEYETVFNLSSKDLSNEKIQIKFYGLDTYANVFLNDSLILQTDNMFRIYTVDCKAYLTEGLNKLRILFESPIRRGVEKHDTLGYQLPVSDNDMAELGKVEGGKQVSVFTRKAPYHFGWDWGPRLVTCGVWRPVNLEFWNQFHINDLFIQQNRLGDTTYLTANIEVETTAKLNAKVEIYVNGKTVAESKNRLKENLDTLKIPFRIPDAKFWWPNGMGKQNLYNIGVEISTDSYKEKKSVRIGLRNLELVTEPDSVGTSFYFKINGKKFFAKGANYIPQDLFLPRVTKEKYKRTLKAAKNTNMNMIRVWGGGVYENDIFYDLCDELGILVWQDFMFSAAMYPGTVEFLQSVKEEAAYNVKRLRNHPSVALWCGNNEILEAWNKWGWKKNVIRNQSAAIADTIWKAYENIFHEILPEAVKKYDPGRKYWSSSPSSGFGEEPTYTNGDMHYWGVWWGQEPFENFLKNVPRFMSEFGFQSFPAFNSVKNFTIPEDYNIYSDVMKSHQRSSIGNKTIEKYLLWYYKKPEDFESLLYVSQLLQAYGVRFGIETHRRNKDYCMGSLYWQLNDCWPGASWSSIDYYGKWKALHYNLEDAFKTFLVSFETTENNIRLYVVSDSTDSVNAELEIRLIGFQGENYNKWQKVITVPNNSSKIYSEFSKDELLSGIDSNKVLLHAKLKTKNKTLAENILYFTKPKDLKLPQPQITYSITDKRNRFEVNIKTENLAKNVYLSYPSPYNFSSNFFDMLPGTEITVSLNKTPEDTLKQFKEKFKIISLIDTYVKITNRISANGKR